MEIIHLILGKANPGRMNGVNKVVDQLATKQTLAGMDVQVWGITANPVHDYPQRNYSTQLFQKRRSPFRLSKALISAMRSKSGKAVFHLHGGYVPAMFAAAMKLHSIGIHFVFTPHGSYNVIARQRSSLQKAIYFRLFEQKLLQRANKIHSLGQSEVAGLHQIFPNQKSALIPYGFEMADTPAATSSSNEFIVGFCGRLDVYTKGLNELLEGFAVFLQQQPGAKLWLIGDSKEQPLLVEKAKALSLQNAVVFWGSQYGDDKLKLLQQCSVFAAPSRNEGLPTAVLEAAALGIACLVTEATNTGAAIRQYDAGEVIASTDALQIASALLTLHHRLVTTKEPMGANAKRMIAEAYNWQHILQQFKQLYA